MNEKGFGSQPGERGKYRPDEQKTHDELEATLEHFEDASHQETGESFEHDLLREQQESAQKDEQDLERARQELARYEGNNIPKNEFSSKSSDAQKQDSLLRRITEQLGYHGQIEDVNGNIYITCDVPAKDMGAYRGRALFGSGVALVRDDLPPRAKQFIRQHEFNHLQNEEKEKNYKGPLPWLVNEIRASTHAITDPVGLLSTLFNRSSWKEGGGFVRNFMNGLRGKLPEAPIADRKIHSIADQDLLDYETNKMFGKLLKK